MKIDNINFNKQLNNNSNIKNINKEETKKENNVVGINISLNIDKIKNSIQKSNGIDYDKVNLFKEKIKNNEYIINFDKLAIKIKKEEL